MLCYLVYKPNWQKQTAHRHMEPLWGLPTCASSRMQPRSSSAIHMSVSILFVCKPLCTTQFVFRNYTIAGTLGCGFYIINNRVLWRCDLSVPGPKKSLILIPFWHPFGLFSQIWASFGHPGAIPNVFFFHPVSRLLFVWFSGPSPSQKTGVGGMRTCVWRYGKL